jgi:hypothetical protein
LLFGQQFVVGLLRLDDYPRRFIAGVIENPGRFRLGILENVFPGPSVRVLLFRRH